MTTAAHQHQLELFVDRHRGWRIANSSSWELQAWSSQSVNGETWELTLRAEAWRLSAGCWVGVFRSESGREQVYRGDYDEVAEAMDRVDRCFTLLNQLKNSSDDIAARDFVVTFKPRDIRVMQQILDIRRAGSWASALEAVIVRVCGYRFRITVDQWRLANV
jgi:hypothetical protein